MFEYQNDPEHSAETDDGNYFELRIDFTMKESEEGDDEGGVALGVSVHSHCVPDNLVVDALLQIARTIVIRGVKANTFSEHVPEEVQNMMAAVFSTQYMKQRLDSDDLSSHSLIDISVPDDASELFD